MSLEGSRFIYKFKMVDLILKVAYTSLKCSKAFVFFYSYLDLIKGIVDINLYKELSSYDLS